MFKSYNLLKINVHARGVIVCWLDSNRRLISKKCWCKEGRLSDGHAMRTL